MKSHIFSLEQIIKPKNLLLIDENIKEIDWIITEPNFYLKNCSDQIRCCDILIGYNDKSARALELKASEYKRQKAIEQIAYGEKLLEKFFMFENLRQGKIVYYTPKFRYELI